jgi:lipoyl synthase
MPVDPKQKPDSPLRKPAWLKTGIPAGKHYVEMKNLLEKNQLNTICQSGRCPNMAECWEAGTATFMILGETCTRGCKFCATKTGIPALVDPEEPLHTALAVASLKLKHAVITSVDRDDLPDYGAAHWANTISEVKKHNPETAIEVLIPDFNGVDELIQQLAQAKPNIIAHNLETVERLTPIVRNRADYRRSLAVLDVIHTTGITPKSGIMVGLGEKFNEIVDTLNHLRDVNCSIITIGQYLQPTPKHLPVAKYYSPEEFDNLKKIALEMGFGFVESAPLVRSSYHAAKHVSQNGNHE